MTDILTSIDPGEWAGFGFWLDSELVLCGRLLEEDYPAYALQGRCSCELPMIYPREKSSARPASIIKLAVTAGRLTSPWSQDRISWFHPKEWKETVPQEILERRILQALRPTEAQVLMTAVETVAEGYRHNVFDAVGVGLVTLKRVRSGIR